MKPAGVLIRLRKESLKNDGTTFQFNQNNLVLLKKRMTPRGKELYGPIT
jgi:ribosomal protein L14